MPNWCSNYATFTHENPEQIKQVIASAKEGKLFETFFPFPNGEWDYGWCVENWGTKWDASNMDVTTDDDDECNVFLSFDTAWGPAIGFYDKMTELGFEIDATYLETGMCFAGHYTSEDGDYSVEYDFSNPDWREEIEDEDIRDMLENEYENWLEWQEEDEDNEEGD